MNAFRLLQLALILAMVRPGHLAGQHPILTGELGPQALRETVRTTFHGTVAESTTDLAAGASIGIPLAWWLIPTLTLRTTLARALPFRSASLGLGVRPPMLRGTSLQLAVVRIQGSQADLGCAQTGADSANAGCPAYLPDRRWGLEARASLDLLGWSRVSAGPTVWWAQSLEAAKPNRMRYRALGVGIQLGLRYAA